MPFDRMITWLDQWALDRQRDDVFAQIGASEFKPKRIRCERFLAPSEFRKNIEQASGFVGHAGMGTIISALQLGKPLLVLPRLGNLGETRNDHQVGTAQRFSESGRILAAYSEEEFYEKLDQLHLFRPAECISATASDSLMHAIRTFVFEPD